MTLNQVTQTARGPRYQRLVGTDCDYRQTVDQCDNPGRGGARRYFFAGSQRAIATGGVFGFWAEHIRNDWNNQIFIDLLLSASCAYFCCWR